MLRNPARLSAKMFLVQQLLLMFRWECQRGARAVPAGIPGSWECLPPSCSSQNPCESPPWPLTRRNAGNLPWKTAQG